MNTSVSLSNGIYTSIFINQNGELKNESHQPLLSLLPTIFVHITAIRKGTIRKAGNHPTNPEEERLHYNFILHQFISNTLQYQLLLHNFEGT